jgi:hypothetical protein
LQALGAAALLPACTTMREPARPLIDTHYHFFAPEFQQAAVEWETKRNIPRFPAAAAWTRARAPLARWRTPFLQDSRRSRTAPGRSP